MIKLLSLYTFGNTHSDDFDLSGIWETVAVRDFDTSSPKWELQRRYSTAVDSTVGQTIFLPSVVMEKFARRVIMTNSLNLGKTDRIEPENKRPADSFVKLPRALTAENGAEALLMGEFFETIEVPCPECAEKDEVSDDCDLCGGFGEIVQNVPVSWDTIKEIYEMIVENMAI